MLYKLHRNDQVHYDEFDAKVIRAVNEAQARDIANERTGDEGKIWVDPDLVSCECLAPIGDAGVILASFNAG